MKLESNFALLDVKRGRRALLKKVGGNGIGGETGVRVRVPVTITGFITEAWGADDGLSQEFAVEVTRVKVND